MKKYNKIVSYRFQEKDGINLRIEGNKVYIVYETQDLVGKTLIADKITDAFLYFIETKQDKSINFEISYMNLIGYLDLYSDKCNHTIFNVKEVKFNHYTGTMYIYIKGMYN